MMMIPSDLELEIICLKDEMRALLGAFYRSKIDVDSLTNALAPLNERWMFLERLQKIKEATA
jgi:hypothetical protein